MIGWFLDHLAWWVIPSLGAAGLVALFVLMRSFGFTLKQAAGIVGTLGLGLVAATIYQKGRTAGARSVEQRQERADNKAVATRDTISADVNRAPKEEVRKRLERWAK